MKTEVVLLGMHINIASQARRRRLVVLIYAGFAALGTAWFFVSGHFGGMFLGWLILFGFVNGAVATEVGLTGDYTSKVWPAAGLCATVEGKAGVAMIIFPTYASILHGRQTSLPRASRILLGHECEARAWYYAIRSSGQNGSTIPGCRSGVPLKRC